MQKKRELTTKKRYLGSHMDAGLLMLEIALINLILQDGSALRWHIKELVYYVATSHAGYSADV